MRLLLALLLTFVVLSSAEASGRNWTLSSIDGNEFNITRDAGGRPSLLVFWATWCKPCKAEIDAMRTTFDSLTERGLNVIMISEDTQRSMSKVKPYIQSKGYTWTALLDPDGAVLKVYSGTSLPFSVLLNSQGVPVYEHRGEMKDPTEMIAKATELLGQSGE